MIEFIADKGMLQEFIDLQNNSKKMNKNPYYVVERIDWSRLRLERGQPFNSTYLMGEFDITQRTAHRDIRYLRKYYGDRLQYDFRDRNYFLNDRQPV